MTPPYEFPEPVDALDATEGRLRSAMLDAGATLDRAARTGTPDQMNAAISEAIASLSDALQANSRALHSARESLRRMTGR